MIDIIEINNNYFNLTSSKSYNINLEDFSTFSNENCIRRLSFKINKFPRTNYTILDNEFFLENKILLKILEDKYKVISYEREVIELFNFKMEILKRKNEKNYLIFILYSNKEEEESIKENYIIKKYIPGILALIKELDLDELNIIYKHRFRKTEILKKIVKEEKENCYKIENNIIIENLNIEIAYYQIYNIVNQIISQKKISPIKNKERCKKCEWNNICQNI